MKSSFLFLLIIMVCANAPAIPLESRQKSKSNIRIQSNQPSVYISFVRKGKVQPLEAGVSDEYVWLRLHNNTRWPIWLAAFGVPKEYGDVGMYYTVESIKERKIVIDSTCHVCSLVPLQSRKSWTFVIPRDHFIENSIIRTTFSFDWEDKNDVFAGREVEHSVTITSSEILNSR